MEEPGGLQSMRSRSWTWLSDFTFTFHLHALEEMTAHSSVPAWRIPGTGGPGGLPSMGSHRVGHDWSDFQQGFPGGSAIKSPPANVANLGSISGSGRSPGEWNDNPLQCSCLGSPMDRSLEGYRPWSHKSWLWLSDWQRKRTPRVLHRHWLEHTAQVSGKEVFFACLGDSAWGTGWGLTNIWWVWSCSQGT